MPQSGQSYKRYHSTPVSSEDTVTEYYEILGCIRTSNDQEIKKAYRRLALKWHPDKNPHNKDEAERKFKKIAEAYEVLSDKDKRQIYDRYGADGLKNGKNPSSSGGTPSDPFFDHFGANYHFRSPFDVFREFFGGRDPFQDFMGRDFQDDFFAMPDPFDRFFAGPLTRKPNGGRVAPYQGSVGGFMASHFHFDPFLETTAGTKTTTDGSGFSSTISFTSGEPGKAASTRKTSTTTRFENGKKIVTKKTEEDGKEVIEICENGKLKSKTVNGVHKPQKQIEEIVID